MTDATTAAKAIQERHENHWDVPMPYPWNADHADAGVVLARLNEAIGNLEAIDQPNDRVVAALACLRGDS